MSRIRTLSVAALVMALAVAASSARAADETKKSDSPAVRGVVTAINTDKDKDVIGTFTVKPMARRSKDAAAAAAPAAEPVTFKVTKDTTFAKTTRKKKGDAAAPADEAATFADLKVDDVVTVEAKDGVATSVKFRAGRKSNKPAA